MVGVPERANPRASRAVARALAHRDAVVHALRKDKADVGQAGLRRGRVRTVVRVVDKVKVKVKVRGKDNRAAIRRMPSRA